MLSLSYIPVSVIYCCLTNYPSTQWFKTVRFLWVSNLASLSQVSLVSQRAAVKVLDPLPSSVVLTCCWVQGSSLAAGLSVGHSHGGSLPQSKGSKAEQEIMQTEAPVPL